MTEVKVPKVRAVVLNWNSAWFTRRCLRSLLDTDYPADRLEIVVVDNASLDGSAEQLGREFPSVRMVRNESNLGFAEGCNRAMRDRRGIDYVALVNNDAVVERGWLRPLVDALESDPSAGAAAARLVLEPGFVPVELRVDGDAVLDAVTVGGVDVTGRSHLEGFDGRAALGWPLDITWHLSGTGRILVPVGDDPTCIGVVLSGSGSVEVSSGDTRVSGPVAGGPFTIPSGVARLTLLNALGTGLNEMGEGFDRGFGRPATEVPEGPVAGFCGGGALLRSAMLDEVGLFDPLLFAYYEDTDLSWRARRRGWSVLAVGDAVIHHAFGGTAGSRASGFFFLDRRNWILTSLRNASPDLRRVVLGAARTQALRSVRANVLGRIRRGWRPTFRLTAMWARIWLGVLAVLPRRGPSAGPPVGAVATNRVRSVFQPAPRPRQPVHRAGGPRLVYVDVTDTLTSGWHAGIQRVVAGLVTALVSADPRIELVPIVWSRPHRRFRRTTSAEWCRLLAPAPPSGVSAEDVPDESGQARQAVASVLRGSRLVEVVREVRRVVARVRTPSDERTLMLDDLESQAVLLELDAVWNQREPDRSDLIAHLRGRGVAVVPFIHDLLPVEHPEWFVPPLVEAFEGTVLAQLEGAELVLVGSSATERSVLELCRSRGWLPPRVAHIPLGAEVSPTTGPGGAPPLPEVLRGRRYALAVGTVEPRKNQERIVEAFELLEQRGERDDLALAVVGRQGWQAEVVADRLRSDAARASGVYWLEGVGDAELAALYAGARLVLAPSYSEGFGLTAVEAARARVPVVASPGGAPGLGPDRLARIVDPDDADAWAEAIRQIALDDEVHTRALERLAGYEPPSWCDSATRTAAHLVEFHGTP